MQGHDGDEVTATISGRSSDAAAPKRRSLILTNDAAEFRFLSRGLGDILSSLWAQLEAVKQQAQSTGQLYPPATTAMWTSVASLQLAIQVRFGACTWLRPLGRDVSAVPHSTLSLAVMRAASALHQRRVHHGRQRPALWLARQRAAAAAGVARRARTHRVSTGRLARAALLCCPSARINEDLPLCAGLTRSTPRRALCPRTQHAQVHPGHQRLPQRRHVRRHRRVQPAAAALAAATLAHSPLPAM